MSTFNHERGMHVTVDGARIYYEVLGNPGAPPLLFLHGGLGTLEDFNSVVPSLANDFRIIAIDSRGHGKSTLGSLPLTYERLQKDVERVLETLQIKKLSITGFSDGGIVALRVAAKAALHIEKLVVIGAEWHAKNMEPLRELFASVTAASWRKKFPESSAAYERLNPEPDFDQLVQRSVKMWLDTSDSGYPGETVRKIRCPLLIVRGDEDHLVSREAAFELSARVADSKLLNFPFAGHVALDDPDGISSRVLQRFLRTVS